LKILIPAYLNKSQLAICFCITVNPWNVQIIKAEQDKIFPVASSVFTDNCIISD